MSLLYQNLPMSRLRFGFDDSNPFQPPLTMVWQGKAAQSLLTLLPDRQQALKNGTADVTAAFRIGTTLLVPLDVPFFPSAKLNAILPNLLALKLPFPLQECRYRFLLPEKTERQSGQNKPPPVLAHVVRIGDLKTRLDELREAGCDPARLVPPGPAAWLQLVSEKPLPDETPRALLLAYAGKTLLATGYGSRLTAVTTFSGDSAAPLALRHLRMAFAGLPDALSIALAGPSAAALADSLRPLLPATASVEILSSPESFLVRSLASPALDSLNLRSGSDARPGTDRKARRIALCASILFSLCSIAAFLSAFLATSSLDDALAEARRERTAALTELAGTPVSARGKAAAKMARDAAAASIDPMLLQSDPTPGLPAILQAARTANIRLASFRLDDEGFAASGKAPSQEAIQTFLRSLAASGISANPDEAPHAEPDGSYAFFIHTGGRSE